MFRSGRIRASTGPALAPLLPTRKDYFCDDCGATWIAGRYLQQFALMGDAYMRGKMRGQKPARRAGEHGAEAEMLRADPGVRTSAGRSGLNIVATLEGRDQPTPGGRRRVRRICGQR
jgi:hypothetical protein